MGWAISDATVWIEVMEEPDPPLLGDVHFSVSETTDVVITFADFRAQLANPTIPEGEYNLDTLQIVTLPNSSRVRLLFNGLPVSAGQKFSRSQLETGSFTQRLLYSYHENSVSFTWNAFDGYNWGISPGRVIVDYVNALPEVSEIVRENLPEDAVQRIS